MKARRASPGWISPYSGLRPGNEQTRKIRRSGALHDGDLGLMCLANHGLDVGGAARSRPSRLGRSRPHQRLDERASSTAGLGRAARHACMRIGNGGHPLGLGHLHGSLHVSGTVRGLGLGLHHAFRLPRWLRSGSRNLPSSNRGLHVGCAGRTGELRLRRTHRRLHMRRGRPADGGLATTLHGSVRHGSPSSSSRRSSSAAAKSGSADKASCKRSRAAGFSPSWWRQRATL